MVTWVLMWYVLLWSFSLCFKNSFVSLLFLFQNSLQYINRAFAKNVWRVLASTHQESSKYISKPAASYFLTSPYARLGWLVLFSSSHPTPNFWKCWVLTKILFFILWMLFKDETPNQLVAQICQSGLCWLDRATSEQTQTFFLSNVNISLFVSILNKTVKSKSSIQM